MIAGYGCGILLFVADTHSTTRASSCGQASCVAPRHPPKLARGGVPAFCDAWLSIAMAVPSPAWVTFDAEKTQGVDLLGLRAPVQAIGNELMNGLTTVTPKLRYLSILSWATSRYVNAGLPDSWNKFRPFVAAQEAALVMANVVRDRTTLRLVGVQEATKRVDSSANTLSLEPLAQQIALNIYASSSEQLGLTFVSDSGVYGLSKERGIKLAQAFDKSVGKTGYGERLAKRKNVSRIRRDEINELAKHFTLDDLPSREATVLVDALLPPEPVNPSEQKRLATLATLLWLGAEMSAKPTEGILFEAAHELPARVPTPLKQTLDGWLAYAIRDGLAVVHEAVFQATMSEVDAVVGRRGAPAPAADVVASILDTIEEHDAQLRALRLISATESIRNMNFQEVADRVRRRCRQSTVFEGGLRRWKAGLSEYNLGNSALGAGRAAAALLPVAWCLVEWRVTVSDTEPSPPPQLLSIGEIFQIGIEDVVLPRLAEYRRSGRSYLDVMTDLVIRTIQQHLRVAWQRFANRGGKDVSVLVADIETWSRKNPFAAGRTDSRLGVAISWLEQLGLIDDTGATDLGKQILARSLKSLEGGAI